MSHLHRGFSLLELLLVLAVLVALAALVWPSLDGLLADENLRKGADQVRAAWTQARVAAMNSGLTHAFRAQANLNVYELQPWAAADSPLEQSTQISAMQPPRLLPTGVVFQAVQAAADTRSLVLAASTENDVELPPVLFYPDGTASAARCVLRNDRQRCVWLELRGLTGVVTVSDVVGVEELPP